jgi:23S rRNA pseudouridine1911/1915/1917 synthase
MTNENFHKVGSGQAGERLDRFLSRVAGIGLRAARRMAEGGLAQVDGSACPPGYKLRDGQVVTLEGRDGSQEMVGAPRLLLADERYVAFFKPSGLNTVSLAGGGGPSLEGALAVLRPGRQVILVNRLDRDTSGVVLGAVDEACARRFRELEDLGQVDKRYLALVLGAFPGPLVLKWALDTADRAKVRVLPTQTPTELRWTRVRPLAYMNAGGDRTLVEARIAKGARHQIRAHLARAGFPIAGDALYGEGQGAGLKLHHWCVRFPGFQAAVAPAWEEVETVSEFFMEENPCVS